MVQSRDLTQDVDTVCGDLLVQGDDLIEAASISVYICEAVAYGERAGSGPHQVWVRSLMTCSYREDGVVEAAR